MAKIAEFEAIAPDGPLILYGYHNLVQGDLTRQDLDTISAARPVYIWHFSGHDFYLNSAAIKHSKLTPALADEFHGIGLDDAGELNGRIYEDAALALFQTIGPILLAPAHIKKGWVTTVAEMGYGIFGRALEDNYTKTYYTDEDNYRLYQVPEHRAFTQEFGADAVAQIQTLSADKTRNPQVLVMKPYWEAGLDIHIHSNGDAAQDSTLGAFSKMEPGETGQRLIIEHGGLFRPDQITKAAELGIGISAASHYVKYMGQDYEEAIGEKTEFITPHTTLHSDAPLAPPQPLKAASVHMTRETRQGGVSNPNEKLTPEQALKAITLGAAWSLGLDDEIGSIEAGKRADFAILESNPLTTAPESWPDIKVWGVMLGGDIRPVQ